MSLVVEIIPELQTWWGRLIGWLGVFSRRLGRHVKFDERSKDYRVILDGHPVELRSKMWERHTPPLNQGKLGSCTGNAIVGLLATNPNNLDGLGDDVDFSQNLAIDLYSRATELDQFSGQYPPTDTGSSVLSAMKAAKEAMLIKEYRWCFGIEDVLRTLAYVGPVAVGVNWYAGFDKPDLSGRVRITGERRGGHAFELLGIDVEKKLVWGINSWGRFWGKCGRFCISFDDLGRLLKERGEAVTVVI
jgi:hypothetical protein